MTKEKSKIDRYNELYSFLSTQVMMEVNRYATHRLFTNDKENIKVESVLSDAIMKTLIRFDVHDMDVPIDVGYIPLSYSKNRDVIDDLIQDKYSFPVKTQSKLEYSRPVKLSSYCNLDAMQDLLSSELITHHIGMKSCRSCLFCPYDNSSNRVPTDMDVNNAWTNMISHAEKKIDEIVSTFNYGAIPSIPYEFPITIFVVSKRVSSYKALSDMNILTEEIATMLMGDLTEQTFDLLRNLPET